jgi:antitoxin (DNA-binding transcriptional repressor) of toxin-antitoxin stability system
MKAYLLPLLAVLATSSLAQAAENSANVPLTDVEQSLATLDKNISQAAPSLPAQKVQGLQAQENTLAERLAKVKAGGPVTAAEHDSLIAAIETQEKQLQAALPKARAVDSAAIPGGVVNGGAGYVPGTYGSTTTIAPNGNAVMSNGPVVNGVPLGDTVVQPAFAQPSTR